MVPTTRKLSRVAGRIALMRAGSDRPARYPGPNHQKREVTCPEGATKTSLRRPDRLLGRVQVSLTCRGPAYGSCDYAMGLCPTGPVRQIAISPRGRIVRNSTYTTRIPRHAKELNNANRSAGVPLPPWQ